MSVFSFRSLKREFRINVMACYAEEHLSDERYLELINLLGDKLGKSSGDDEDEKVLQPKRSFLNYFALRKVLNPFNSIRFSLLTLISMLDYLLRILGTGLITLSFGIVYLLTLPLRLIWTPLAIGVSRLLVLPVMLLSSLLHSGTVLLRTVVNYIFSPINSFIRPLFWNYFLSSEHSTFAKAVVAFYYIAATVGLIVGLSFLTSGGSLPLALVIVGGILFIPPILHMVHQMVWQVAKGIYFTTVNIFSRKFNYHERYSKFVDPIEQTYGKIRNVYIKNPDNEFNAATKESFENTKKSVTRNLFHSSPNVHLEPSRNRSFLNTFGSFSVGWEPKDVPEEDKVTSGIITPRRT